MLCISLSLQLNCTRRNQHSFPTRRSSDLLGAVEELLEHHRSAGEDHGAAVGEGGLAVGGDHHPLAGGETVGLDRKSTRLNSSHVASSYAVFCLKKKRRKEDIINVRR